jgi:hypothetical protein
MENIGLKICILLILVNGVCLTILEKIKFKEKNYSFIGKILLFINLVIIFFLAKFS